MEKNHMCKFCSKKFPCGRSLGGHMRSHLIAVPPSDHPRTDQKLPKKKLPSLPNAKHGLKDALLDQDNPCKECGKTFHSSKALFGHMKTHSVLATKGATTTLDDQDSWNTSSSEGTTRRKRSKRYNTTTNTTNSSSLTDSDVDLQEQEEVALTLILLSSTDKGNLGISSTTAFASSEAKKKRKIEYNEVNSPKTASKLDLFDAKSAKFECVICRKAFPSYQALGGHRASHKKFKGCCAPTSDPGSLEADRIGKLVGAKKHECPICFKVFGSGQALGGHKRSHLIGDQAKSGGGDPGDRAGPSVRAFLDLNLPAPDEEEEECDGFKNWWIGTSHQHERLLGLI